ncbi:MAG: hypothetical protein M1819_006114 [Sarea resinae]|nr:MAG: hypothetical protein M1819_006114 [Sarea resinae]
MLGSEAHGDDKPISNLSSSAELRSRIPTNELVLPKIRSTGNLLSYGKSEHAARTRFSFDAGSSTEHDSMSRSPILSEHDHGLKVSGLRRIRQQPTPRVPSVSGSTTPITRASSSITLSSLPTSRVPSLTASAGPSSPSLNFSEDLSRFPSESLHSFSFAHQSEDSIHNRQNVLKRSIEFMRDRLGWAGTNPGIASAQAKISGDQELQSMVELLTRANMFAPGGPEGNLGLGLMNGPLTGPAMVDGENVFEKSFMPQSESPKQIDDEILQRRASPSEIDDGLSFAVKGNHHENGGGTKGSNLEASSASSNNTVATSPDASRSDLRNSSLANRRMSLKRTYTDTKPLTLQTKLMEVMAQPYIAADNTHHNQLLSPMSIAPVGHSYPPPPGLSTPGPSVHGHASRWAPAAQAIFTTEAHAPWTILAANDLACLVFGVTKAEVRKIGIMEVVQEERRKWLEEKLRSPGSDSASRKKPSVQPQQISANPTTSLAVGTGLTARLLSKPPSRAKTDDGFGSSKSKSVKGGLNHVANKSRGVLLCGDVVPIQKRNGATGSASLWVKEKRGGLIWVVEEIVEDRAYLSLDERGTLIKAAGAIEAIWGVEKLKPGTHVSKLIPRLPQKRGSKTGMLDYTKIAELRRFTARNAAGMNIPTTIDRISGRLDFKVSCFPHIAGILVLSASSLHITSSNSVFSAALFGHEQPDGLSITDLIPEFSRILRIMTEEDKVQLVDGIVIPEHSFRRARALLALRDGNADAAAIFLCPTGLVAKHLDGSDILVDVQMRVVKSESFQHYDESVIDERSENGETDDGGEGGFRSSEVVYALWITYSRHLHAAKVGTNPISPLASRPGTPPHQPSPGQTVSNGAISNGTRVDGAQTSLLTQQLKEATSQSISDHISKERSRSAPQEAPPESPPPREVRKKKTIQDFVILEDMGQGAYGQVKLARDKTTLKKVVLKYVTKRRILVDTWTRDRRLGTVPLEIHVLDYLNRDGLKHPNIVEMSDFFEDDINYYIEMVPHGLPGMDLFDYIELRVNMEEAECKSIFVQVANALHHLHTKALVVHRDIKDENVILDGEGNIKLIDFGSAAYIKNGPFDVFVGTIDYAAPEVLAGKSYRGKEQDVWALGILLYTIIYKENPFYSIDEIMDHDLRVPYVMSEESIDLVRCMLDRDVGRRLTIEKVLEHPWCLDVVDR